MSVTIRKVETPADHKAFFEFPWQHYKDDPNWVPPLLSMRADLLNKKKAPCWEYMEGDYFTAWRGDQIVGTIVALVNHRHNEFHNENVGWFGMFESIDDQEVANALLSTAQDWVCAKGCTALLGPQNFTTHDETGLLVDGFTPPVLLMPYNPPYYARLIETAGFQKIMNLYSLYFDLKAPNAQATLQRLGKIIARAEKRGIVVRPFNTSRKKEEFRLLKDLYNAAWDKNWGFTPMTERELDGLIEGLGTFFDPKLAFFAEVNGDAAGFILGIPDLNQVIKRANPRPGVPEVVSLLQAVWYWKLFPVYTQARVPLLGLKEQYRKMGVSEALCYHILKAGLEQPRYEGCDFGWMLETNHDIIGLAKGVGMDIYKTHRFYQKTCGA
jgi:hypothetical protein